MSDDRTVHAVTPLFGIEIVRYDRSGKWWIEAEDRREHVPIGQAVDYAVMVNAAVRFGLPGGSTFDRLVRSKRKAS